MKQALVQHPWSAEGADEVLADYVAAVGQAEMVRTFGYELRGPLPREHGFAYLLAGERVAWGGLVPNASPRSFTTRICVWPGVRGRGVRTMVKDLLAYEAFAMLGAEYLTPKIQLTNGPQLLRVLRAAAAGSIWRLSHVTLYPPAAVHFVVHRQDYLSRLPLEDLYERFNEPRPESA